MQMCVPVADVQYVTCRAHTCTEANRNYPFQGFIDISSLVVQDDYIFIQVGPITAKLLHIGSIFHASHVYLNGCTKGRSHVQVFRL